MRNHEGHILESGEPKKIATRRAFRAGVATIGLLSGLAFTASAQAEDFYKGKTVELLIGYPAGSGYDIYARLVADNIVRFLPGKPNIIPRNMPGAGSWRVVKYIYEVAKKDGTVWGSVDRGAATEPLLYGTDSKAPFKNPLDLTWIGSLTNEIGVAAVWHTTGIKNWEETIHKPVIVSMASAQGGLSARAINAILGTQFKQVCCYGGDTNQNLAMERGEVEGRIGWSWSSLKATHMDWVKEGKINLLMQVGLEKNPEIPGDIPLVLDLTKDEKDKAALKIIFSNQSIGRPFIMPGGVAPERIAEVRHAFTQMVTDPAFLAKAEKERLEIDGPKSGEEIEALLKEVYASPADAIAAARTAIKEGEIKMLDSKK
jgi:tripartite-type tricarboxylate transporter receptor subunit TctC